MDVVQRKEEPAVVLAQAREVLRDRLLVREAALNESLSRVHDLA
jgi:hypothetical protein